MAIKTSIFAIMAVVQQIQNRLLPMIDEINKTATIDAEIKLMPDVRVGFHPTDTIKAALTWGVIVDDRVIRLAQLHDRDNRSGFAVTLLNKEDVSPQRIEGTDHRVNCVRGYVKPFMFDEMDEGLDSVAKVLCQFLVFGIKP